MMSYEARVNTDTNQLKCCRHYLKFNGKECTQPGTIEGINTMNNKVNVHRPNISM